MTALRSLPAPASLPRASRIAPTELQTFTVQATLVGFKLEDDHDIHAVLADPDDPSATMIVELVDISCSGAAASSAAARMQAARADFIRRFGSPDSSFQRVSRQISVTGIGFFDTVHGQTGVAPNGIELHQVLALGP